MRGQPERIGSRVCHGEHELGRQHLDRSGSVVVVVVLKPRVETVYSRSVVPSGISIYSLSWIAAAGVLEPALANVVAIAVVPSLCVRIVELAGDSAHSIVTSPSAAAG